MKLTVYFLKDSRAGLKQKKYMERHFFMGKQTGVKKFMYRIDILSNYLPLFPPIINECMQ
jgi:hypothetical protein